LKPYSKPWLSVSDQLHRLIQRGLVVDNLIEAKEFLSHVNYYRLRGYCLAFEESEHQFFPGTNFEDIYQSYQFDATLRLLLIEAVGLIEIDFRSSVAYYFTEVHGPYGHTDQSNLFIRNPVDYQKWLTQVREEVERAKNKFRNHFKNTYDRYPDLPLWVATELMSFGSLSKLYSFMNRNDQIRVSNRYGFRSDILKGFIHHASYVRNMAAHVSIIWNVLWDIRPKLPDNHVGWERKFLGIGDRISVTLLMLYRLLLNCSGQKQSAMKWKARVDQLLKTPPKAPNAMKRMGMVPPLQNNPLWQ
jgi:abortive infection bacteriophage resistance protein